MIHKSLAEKKKNNSDEFSLLGFLHFLVSLCSIALWNHHCSSKRNRGRSNHQKERPGQNLGGISGFEPEVN